MLIFLLLFSIQTWAGGNDPIRASMANHIQQFYPDQLTNPQKKNRKSMAQFGYNLSYFTIKLFPITEFIDPDDFGIHSYSKPSGQEQNGSLYTCKGGFIDFSHLRAAADWTVYLTFTILNDPSGLELPEEAGQLKLKFKNLDELSNIDVANLAQKIAFERLEWHEVASWHYHAPYHMRSDQQSSFSPEDNYSNLLGTEIGKRIALRIMNEMETSPYEEVATEEIEKYISLLEPVQGKKESKMAYDIVDRHKQLELPATERNNDVWWDSNILFRDQRYVFKRNLDMGPVIEPWLVPQSEKIGCEADVTTHPISVPQKTNASTSFYSYYDFTITPDKEMFYGRKGKKNHKGFSAFKTKDFQKVIDIIADEMENVLFEGFDKRDCCDPVAEYKNVRRVGLAAIVSGKSK